MRGIAKTGFVTLILLVCAISGSYGQHTANLSIENARTSGGYFYWDIYITRTNDWGADDRNGLGDCSWYFDYNTSALSSPTLTYENPTYVKSPEYTNSAGISGNQVWVTTELNGGQDGINLPTSKTHLYTVRMTIDNSSAESDLYWNEINTGIFNARDESVNETYDNNGDTSLPVQMANIMAMSDREYGVMITWHTESESGCAGFYVWRSEAEEGDYVRITTALITGQGNTSSASEYNYSDRNVRDGVTYWYKIEEISSDGFSTFHGLIDVEGISPIPTEFSLSQNYPNPFNPETTIKYQLAEDGKAVIVVYNLIGKLVKELVNEEKKAGYYSVVWDGTDDLGRLSPSGVYVLVLNAGTIIKTQKVMLVR